MENVITLELLVKCDTTPPITHFKIINAAAILQAERGTVHFKWKDAVLKGNIVSIAGITIVYNLPVTIYINFHFFFFYFV